MKRVAVITLTGYENYGNRLQNYALQETLTGMGCRVKTLRVDEPEARAYDIEKKKLSIALLLKNTIVRGILGAADLVKQRTKHIRAFSAKYIVESDYSISNNHIPADLNDQYDYFVIGSDQIWNPSYGYSADIMFAAFASPEKRIAYAPSFGVSQLIKGMMADYFIGLPGISHISVREETGAEIVSNITGKAVPVLADPTMLLTKDEWLSIASPPKNKPKAPYIVTYCLGSIPKHIRDRLHVLCETRQLELVNIVSIRDLRFYGVNPAEFIDLINTAECLITDSFHGSVFAILMQTPFVICKRVSNTSYSMYSRLESLLRRFHFEDREWDSIRNDDAFLQMDFSEASIILKQERKKAMEFLETALCGNEPYASLGDSSNSA
jgi:hypothetical protein